MLEYSKFLASCLILVLVLNCYLIYKVEASQVNEVIWVRTENLGLQVASASGVVADSSGFYVVGTYVSLSSLLSFMNPYKWLIEKRSLTDGKLIWNQTSAGADTSVLVTADSSGLYVVGTYLSLTSRYQWLVEKRSLADGKLIWNQTSTIGTTPYNAPRDVAVSDSGIYIVGSDTSQGASEWRIEKRSLSDGSLTWVQTINPSLQYADEAYGVAVDSSGIYVVGIDLSVSTSSSSQSQWRIEKRSLTDGSLLWVKLSNPSKDYDGAMDVAIDASGIYVVGFDASLSQSNHEWRIEKRSLTDGTSIWDQTSNPSDSSDEATHVAIDASGIYVVGFYRATSNQTDRIMKMSLTDGKLIWIQRSTDGKISRGVAIDASGVLLVGPAWRIVKRSVSAGSTQDDSVYLPFYMQTWFYGIIVAIAIVVVISIFILRRKRPTISNLIQPTITYQI